MSASPRGPAPVDVVLARAFAPLHKRVLGTAVGLVAAVMLFVATLLQMAIDPKEGPTLWLLQHYFYGYRVTLPGAFVGAWWGFVTGFVAGWFAAFVRNFAIALWLFIVRTKADLTGSRDFLDHI